MVTGQIYQKLLRPALFKFDAEKVHHFVLNFGENLGKYYHQKSLTNSSLLQNICGVDFSSPIGLAPGFDYEGRLTQILPAIGFGFETIGTITNLPYQGNPKPIIGRLPKSKSLMVNKGFKNLGADATIKKLSPLNFSIPIGISICSREASLADIVSTFEKFERSNVNHVYYELNISCPNLQTTKDFYSVNNLTVLLKTIGDLKISRPVFVKMPISKTDGEVLKLLDTISKHTPQGIILGNLQKDRQKLHPSEIYKYSVGNFSGKPTYERSNELIKLAYKNFKKRFVIIGCGGVFSAADAYEKITQGASLVQLITGLVYQGPQLVNDINQELVDLLKKDGYKNISEAIGSKN